VSASARKPNKAQRAAQAAVKQARKDVHRTHLLEAAERVFAARGYEDTRMQDIAAAAGLALATMYGVVGGKEELYAQIHEMRGRALLQGAMAAAAGAGSAMAALLAGVRAYAEYLLARPDYLRLHLQESQPWALAPRFTSPTQGQLWQEGLTLSVETFRAAIAEGTVIAERPELLARLMIAAHQVHLGEWIAAGMQEPPEQIVQRMQSQIVRAFGTARALNGSSGDYLPAKASPRPVERSRRKTAIPG
jgi:AcrR family transcriptional regulator